MEAATRFRIYLASQKFKIIVDYKSLTFIDHLKSPTSPRLQRWAMFMSQLSYEIVYKKGRLHTNADGISRRTYEPVETPTPTVTDNLTDDNFVNSMDLRMSERDFNSWMVQLANENRENYRLKMELQNYIMAIEREVDTPINFKAEGALCLHSEELKDIEPPSQGSMDLRLRRSTDLKVRTVAIRITMWAHISSLNEKR